MQDTIAFLTDIIVDERPVLLRLMYRIIRNKEAAEDAVQSLFEKILRIEQPGLITNPKAYLYRLASNLAIDHARRIGRQDDVQDSIHDLLWLEDDKPSAEQHTAAKKQLENVENIIETMPEPMKTFFYLNRFQGLTQTEIASRHGKSVSIVNRYIHQALERLSCARDK
ncbi:RNA polymerase sigma-24 factor [Acetobacter tropicalis NRIC 0312]|uniref:RNA polymerase subunit sigma-24 n=1 Tax=Acetobacter tropicalis TaxID=104102 RepID=A0A0C9LM04_9PROT|nr:RNA polymerase sigma factor [Acetobacter tropicalis]KXV49406.1 hypothetical protein AD944_07990 [Acetobacter tropicalis]KXV56069.1 hypothetical protein AD947_12085 [Acetobacter tropicalis]OUI85398.1 hypothetical protein HC62_11110 [Acetobacter tropicalis]GAL99137.1 RNA polymerase ECF sigma factor [Acetobacter tropicalis]GBR68255.1 RNA polymerase sigma-24 factor [Acetobacter tropicalis NRIC 0312]